MLFQVSVLVFPDQGLLMSVVLHSGNSAFLRLDLYLTVLLHWAVS